MNEISEIDQALLKKLKSRIEERAGLSGNPDLTQKDFDFLLYYIQEETGQALSLTTIKRIWRNEFQRLPHLSTLDMLARIAYDHDWYTARKVFLEVATNVGKSHPDGVLQVDVPEEVRTHRRWPVKLVAGLVALAPLSLLLYNFSHTVSGDVSTVEFTAKATADLRVPNSVVFSYDLHDFKADHFYIQQSWDPVRKVEISPTENRQTDIYYEPGYYYAKLLADDKVVKEIPVHIKYNDWFVRFRYPDSELVKIDDTDLITSGHLGLQTNYVRQLTKTLVHPFQLGYMLSKDFNLQADDFQIDASVRFDSVLAPSCPMINLLIKGDRDYAWITLGNKGCESNLGLKVGDSHVNGKTNDLSRLGMDSFSWQNVRVTLTKGTYTLSINNLPVHKGAYSNMLGELKEIDFFFNGIGRIDEIRIADNNDHPKLNQSF